MGSTMRQVYMKAYDKESIQKIYVPTEEELQQIENKINWMLVKTKAKELDDELANVWQALYEKIGYEEPIDFTAKYKYEYSISRIFDKLYCIKESKYGKRSYMCIDADNCTAAHYAEKNVYMDWVFYGDTLWFLRNFKTDNLNADELRKYNVFKNMLIICNEYQKAHSVHDYYD